MMKLPKIFRRDKATAKTIKRGFNAASRNRLFSDWVTSPASADSEIYNDLALIRDRARDLERNETYVEKFLFELENNVIGSEGIRLRSEPSEGGKFDQLAKDAIEWAWYHQGKMENWLVTKNMTESEADRMAIRSVARDGELIMRIVKGYDNKFRFSVQYIEPDHLDHTFMGKAPNGNEIRMGVELNHWKVPVAYWITAEHPGELYACMRHNGSIKQRIPANEIRFPFRPTRAGQTRAVSWLVTAMNHLKMLGGYEEAELVAARTAAAKMGFFTKDGGEGYGPTNPDDPEEAFSMEAEPGVFDQLPDGLKFQQWDPQHPTTAFEGFRKAMLRRVASGLTMSYNTLANDLEGVSYSSLRDGKITERDGYKVLQNWYIDTVKRPIFLEWLEHSLDFGFIRQNNGRGAPLPATKLDKFAEHSFIPRRWQWVDPKKDAEAAILARDNNWISDSQIVAEQGREYDHVLDQIANDRKTEKDKGVEKQLDNVSKKQIQKVSDEDETEGN